MLVDVTKLSPLHVTRMAIAKVSFFHWVLERFKQFILIYTMYEGTMILSTHYIILSILKLGLNKGILTLNFE